MTPEIFNQYLQDPSLLNNQSVEELQIVVKEFPYFQVARMLLAKNLYNIQHEGYNLSLRLAAAYAGDRSKLKSLIEGSSIPSLSNTGIEPKNTKPVEHQENGEGNDRSGDFVSSEIEEAAEIPTVGNKVETPEMGFSDHLQSSNIIRNPLIDSIITRLSVVEIDESEEASSNIAEEQYENNKTADKVNNMRNELVDKFIREEPRITAPKHEFFNPEEIARQSTTLPDDVVSETLAKIYEQQGLFTMAIKIYEKLMLLIPEKSSYFAARIKEIANKRK